MGTYDKEIKKERSLNEVWSLPKPRVSRQLSVHKIIAKSHSMNLNSLPLSDDIEDQAPNLINGTISHDR